MTEVYLATHAGRQAARGFGRGTNQISGNGRNPSATEWRTKVARDVSRGRECAIAKSHSRGDRIPADENFLSPLCGLRFPIPQPTSEATGFYRCSAATYRRSQKLICDGLAGSCLKRAN